MVSKEGKQGLALLVVVIVVLSVMTVGVLITNNNNNKDNPNGILGTYDIVDYTQYGGEGSSTNWKWYETGCGSYEGEKIRIDSYEDGTIRGTCMLGGDEYDIVGYYNPDNGYFGYTSYYDYTPEGDDKVIDWLHGAIIGDTMYLHGYTMSADKVDDPVIYTFNFTFVKEGKQQYTPMSFKQVLFSDAPMISTKTWAMVGTEETDSYPYSFTLTVDKDTDGEDTYDNGVYQLTETTKDSDGNVTNNKMTASTIYQDNERTVLRAIGYYGPSDYNICWYVIEGKHMYCLFNSNAYPVDNVSCRTLYTSDGTAPTFAAPYDIEGTMFNGSVTCDSYDFSYIESNVSQAVLVQGENSNVAVTAKGLQINMFSGVGTAAFFYNGELNNVTYYGDMMGTILSDGNVFIYGFIYGSDGDAFYVHGTLKAHTI